MGGRGMGDGRDESPPRPDRRARRRALEIEDREEQTDAPEEQHRLDSEQQYDSHADDRDRNQSRNHNNNHNHNHDDNDDHHELFAYVDQNRNLNLTELLDKEPREETHDDFAAHDAKNCTTRQGVDEKAAAPVGAAPSQRLSRDQANVSPILSLSSDQSSSDCITTTTTTSISDPSTQRLSQTSLTLSPGVRSQEQPQQQQQQQQQNLHHDHRHHHQHQDHDHHLPNHFRVDSPEQKRARLQKHVTIDILDHTIVPPGRTTSSTVHEGELARKLSDELELHGPATDHLRGGPLDDVLEMCHKDDLQHSTDDHTKSDRAGPSIVRQLGRRISVVPQFLVRRMSRASHPSAGRLYDERRRHSMPPGQSSRDQSPSARTSGASNSDRSTSESALLESAPSSQNDVPLATVAGVGGTITTVTRSKRKTAPLPRLVAKSGQVNLFLDNIDRRQYVRDLFTTMIDIKWRYNLMAAAFGFVFSWLFFACIWYLVLYFHDDLEHEHDPSWSPCIVNVYSFPAALLFSIETQSTLGFGSRIISVECPGAIVIFCSQLIFGVVVECLIVGMVFAKLSRPTKRSQTIMYSKYATICLREHKMCLTFRVGDVRSKSHIIGATIRASLVSSKTTAEGETIPFYHYNLKVIIDDCENSLLLIWPVTIVHVIDQTSPFYALDADQLASFKFEIITVLEGTVESTGQSIQVRSSYLPSEVKWGYRFEPIVSTHGYGRHAQTIIDYNKFNRIVEVPTPRSSPLQYYASSESTSAPISQSDGSETAPTSDHITEDSSQRVDLDASTSPID